MADSDKQAGRAFATGMSGQMGQAGAIFGRAFAAHMGGTALGSAGASGVSALASGFGLAGAIGGVAGAGAGLLIQGALSLGSSLLGVGDAYSLLKQNWSPDIYTSGAEPSTGDYAGYRIGGYSINLVANIPLKEDLVRLDKYFEYNGVATDENSVPLIYDDDREFVYIKADKAVIECNVRAVANQLTIMLNNGCRFWQKEVGGEDVSPLMLEVENDG